MSIISSKTFHSHSHCMKSQIQCTKFDIHCVTKPDLIWIIHIGINLNEKVKAQPLHFPLPYGSLSRSGGRKPRGLIEVYVNDNTTSINISDFKFFCSRGWLPEETAIPHCKHISKVIKKHKSLTNKRTF